jgi:hypothetical protein
MSRMLIDTDPLTGESVWYDFNRATMQATITHEQPVSDIIDNNVTDTNDTWRTQEGIKRDWWHYARVPNTVIIEWKQKYGVDFYNQADKKKVFQLLNSPDYKLLKTTHKHHSEK